MVFNVMVSVVAVYNYYSIRMLCKIFDACYSVLTDINECDTNNGGCEQQCINANGSFSCTCYDGYNLVNGTCTGIPFTFIYTYFMHAF